MNNSMMYLIVAVLVIIMLGLVVLLFKSSSSAYQPAALMTGNEREFFFRLRSALPGKFIFVQVAFPALIQPSATRGTKRHLMDFRRMSQKRADYVVYDEKLNLLAVVELDDRTHNAAQDMIRDGYLASAGIRTIRYESKNKPSKEMIAAQFSALAQGYLP